ncbi:MAG: hypothetical protein WBW61_02235 [Rhodanobacteraceae bacterium]
MVDKSGDIAEQRWWVAAIGDTLVWARLHVRESGIAEVFDCDGRTLAYDDETSARMALLDADFRAWDGLDETDAATLGFDLASTHPPQADNDAELVLRMVQSLGPRQ